MLEYILQLDTQLFYLINVTLQNVIFDWLMPFITEKTHWFPVWGVVIILLLWKGGKQGRIVLVLIIPLIFLSDQLSSSILKPLIARTRPCVALDNVHLLVNKTTSFSFPSSHAVNFFALATYFGYFYRKYIWWFLLLATLVAYSRVYVGVHYPFDVLAGAIVGVACAFTIIYLWKFSESLYKKHTSK